MKKSSLATHLAGSFGITALLALGMIYPFLPGRYDGLAVVLSTMIQGFGVFGLLLVPSGAVWLVHELREGRRSSHSGRAYRYAIASLIVGSIVAVLVSLVAFMSSGVILGLCSLVLWLYALARLLPRLNGLKTVPPSVVNPVPIYLVVIPVLLVSLQVLLASPVTTLSRNRTIAGSAEILEAIERHRTEQGRYPSSLLAAWKDFDPPVVGVERFHYLPQGDAYTLFFEQPRFLFDNIGTREFVAYNRLGEHLMPSHASWILSWPPEQLAENQGWYAVHDTPNAHWKYFWFD